MTSTKTVAHFVPKALTPTAEQTAIQISPARVAIVEANAGAAKTTVLALRMAEAWTRGTRAEQIFALTYTDAACVALRGALKKIGVPAAVVQQMRIQTFEAFSTQVLAELEGGKVPVYTEAEQFSPLIWEAVQQVAEHPDARWRSELLMPTLGDHGMTDAFLQQGEILKGTLRDVLQRDEQAVSPDYADSIGTEYTQLKIYLAFERIRCANPEKPAFRGPQDATYDLARLLHGGESVLHTLSWPQAVKVLVVDEMHDMNQAMFTLLQALLASNRCFFCGVGDIDQVIHKATGADAQFMRSALEEHSTHTVQRYPLTHSFRFSPAVAKLAGAVARNKPYASLAPHATTVAVHSYTDNADCARQVVAAAQHWKAQPKGKMDAFAVLLRHPHQSVQIENALITAGIPYTTQGFDSYVQRPEVLLLRGLLAVATDDLASITGEQTRKNILRALVFFAESHIQVDGREHESQQDLLDDAVRTVAVAPTFLKSFFENQVLRNAPPSTRKRLQAAVDTIRSHTGAGLLAAVLAALHAPSLVRNVLTSTRRRVEAESNLAWLAQAAEGFASPARFFQHLNTTEQKQQASAKDKAASLLIASITSVKGLEFDAVLLPYLAQGEFPDPHGDADEELNTLYVGITRARRALTVYTQAERPGGFSGFCKPPAPLAG
ncbi:3'-5' exonuclease [Rhodoferax sp. WC2427]|uniref:3'-5' exonuclease n=1 Tax=Rhodoferax sp. WC2427 TaxID=3234144 RepID=UPI0034666F58